MISDAEIEKYSKGIIEEGTTDRLAQAIRGSKTVDEALGHFDSVLKEIGEKMDTAMEEIFDRLAIRTRRILEDIFDD